MNNKVIELSNIEINEHCFLNTITGEKIFSKKRKKTRFFSGIYFKDEKNFFALYPTKNGPVIFFDGKRFPLKKELNISLSQEEKTRVFRIEDYNIVIRYKVSIYTGLDCWSNEEDVDLFFQINKLYKSEEYYRRFTTRS